MVPADAIPPTKDVAIISKSDELTPQGDDRSPPLPISSHFFSTFIDVSGSDPRSLIKL